MTRTYTTYYAAQDARNSEQRPRDWVIVPYGLGRCLLICTRSNTR